MTYLITSEVFPTVCRSTAIGFSSTPGRLFMIFYSYVIQIGQDQLPWISPLCMGTLAMCSAVASLALPDTRSTALLATISDTEHYYRAKETILKSVTRRMSRVREHMVTT